MTHHEREQIGLAAKSIHRTVSRAVNQMASDGPWLNTCIVWCDAEDFFPWLIRVGNVQGATIDIWAIDVQALLSAWHQWGKDTVKEAIEQGLMA